MKQKDQAKPYTPEEAVWEAKRCLQCVDSHCNKGCPAGVDVRRFVGEIASGNLVAASRALKQKNILPLICALICPVEHQCEQDCCNSNLSYPISISRLQQYVALRDLQEKLYQPGKAPSKGLSVAVIGGGAAGLAAAAELALLGYDVTILERRPQIGGLLRYGIPQHRLPRELVERELTLVEGLGINVVTEAQVSRATDLLDQGFEAVFIAVGLGGSPRLNIPGEELEGVHSALDVLGAANEGEPLSLGGKVVVIGGGDVAMDAACTALRSGATQVETACLEAPNEMPASKEEIEQAWEEGVIFHYRVQPLEILGSNGHVEGLKAVRIEWKEPGRYVPSNAVQLEGTEFVLKAQSVIKAIGQYPAEECQQLFDGLETDRGYLVVDADTFQTSRPGVFAGGDIAARCGLTVVKCVAEGKKAAQSIDEYLAAKG